MTFGRICSQNRRLVVIHHTHLIQGIMNLLKRGDLVFFDDCLYSQYVFLHRNSDALDKLDIIRVLGLSPKAVRSDETDGIYGVESAVLHNWLNEQVKSISDEINGDYIRGFMSISEVKALLSNNNTFLALHGCCHLDLKKTPKFDQPMVFSKDLEDGMEALRNFGLDTDIFVYPYAYEPFLSNRILQERGFRHVFAGKYTKRIPIEKLTHDFREHNQK